MPRGDRVKKQMSEPASLGTVYKIVTIAVVLGGVVWAGGEWYARSAQTQEQVSQHDETIQEIQKDVGAIKGDVREIKGMLQERGE